MNTKRFDITMGFSLAFLALLLRLPFRSHYLYHWDSVNFALSLENYDVRLHQPHPPGYFLYSMLGRLVDAILNDANLSLVLISLVSGVLGVVAIYWLGMRMFDRRVGIVAALLALTSPMHWFYSGLALSYELEFLLVTLLAGLSYLLIRGQRRLWPWLAVLLAVAGGIRQNDLVFMLPLWLFTLYYLPWRERILSALLAGAIVLAWAVPMVMLSGGLPGYLSALGAGSSEIVGESSLFSITQLGMNAVRMIVFVGYGLLLANLLLLWGAWRLLGSWRLAIRDPRAWILALWILPSVLFYVFIHLRQHGHIFTFLPALLLLAAFLAVDFADRIARPMRWPSAAAALTAVLIVPNIAFFLFAPPQLFGSDRLIMQTPSWNSIAQRDRLLGERLVAIRSNFDPSSTVVLAGARDFRIPDYYLRDFQATDLSYRLPDAPTELPDNVTTVVMMEPLFTPEVLSTLPRQTIPLPNGGQIVYVTWSKGEHAWLCKECFDIIKK